MKKIIIYSVSLLISLTFLSCEKILMEKNPENTPINNFNSMWERINERYTFLEYKNINWDSVKIANENKISPTMSDDSLFKVLADMLYVLKDGHVNLYTPYNISRNWTWYLDSSQNFNFSVLERNYLKNDFEITGPFYHKTFKKYDKQIGYFYYGSFSSSFSDEDYNYILDKFNTTDGLIIDLRDNGGGLTTNVFKLINRYVNKKQMVGYCMEKSGPGKNDFIRAIDLYVEPSYNYNDELNSTYYDKPIIILSNRSCYSACNMFIGFMSQLPNVKIIGDWSGGGGGLPTSYQLPNGWTYRFSTTMTLLNDGFNIENGVPTDIQVKQDPYNLANGIDDILEIAFDQFQ